jgi:hypothetical protein
MPGWGYAVYIALYMARGFSFGASPEGMSATLLERLILGNADRQGRGNASSYFCVVSVYGITLHCNRISVSRRRSLRGIRVLEQLNYEATYVAETGPRKTHKGFSLKW